MVAALNSERGPVTPRKDTDLGSGVVKMPDNMRCCCATVAADATRPNVRSDDTGDKWFIEGDDPEGFTNVPSCAAPDGIGPPSPSTTSSSDSIGAAPCDAH